jgi:hypothetical protein
MQRGWAGINMENALGKVGRNGGPGAQAEARSLTTYDGTELELRVHLKAAGMQGIDIDRLFKQAS